MTTPAPRVWPRIAEEDRKVWVERRQALLHPKRTPHFAAYWANKRVACRLNLVGRVAHHGAVPVWRVTTWHLAGWEPEIRRRDLLALRGVLRAWWDEQWRRIEATEAEAEGAWRGEGA